MIKKRNLFKKFGLMAFALACAVTAFIVPTFAYSEDSNGNLVSDNLYNIGAYNGTINGVSMNVSNQTLTLNGTSSNGSWNNRSDLSITLPAGTYTIQWFTNYVGNNVGFGLRSSGTGLTELYQLNTQRYKTFTINESTTFTTVIWWQTSGIIFDNVKISCMVYNGNYKAYSVFEPYGKTYYADRYITDASVMDYTNISKAYFSHPYGNISSPNMAYTAFIYKGKYGYLWDNQKIFDWNDFEYVVNGSDTYIKDKIYSNYGSFYNTEWTSWQLITLGGTATGHYTAVDTIATTLTYEFITPINLINVGFDFGSFDYINFYDSRGNMLGFVSKNDNVAVSYKNVAKIVGERKISDLPEDNLYIASSLSSGYYDFGYKDGYNNGYNDGVKDGSEESLSVGYQEGYREGKIDGYDEGYKEALGEDLSSRGFWGLLNSIFSFPVNMIKNVFNFEFMGINIASLITFVISIVVVALIVRKFTK